MESVEIAEKLLQMEICRILFLFMDSHVQDRLSQTVKCLNLTGIQFQSCEQSIAIDLVFKSHVIVLTVQQFFSQKVSTVKISFHLPQSQLQITKNNLQPIHYKIKMLKSLLFLLALLSTNCKLIWLADIANPGARYPINDVYDGKENPEKQGQLNSVGMRQQFLLGTYLRADYIDREGLISGKYNPNYVEVFACSGMDRTYDSALSRLYGLFPLGTGWQIPEEAPKQRWEPPFESNFTYRGLKDENDLPFGLDNGFQPVPIWPLDEILNDPCPNSGILKTKRLQQISKALTAFEAQHSALLTKLKLIFNLSSLQLNIPTMADLYDTLVSDLTLGKELPKEFDEYDRKSLKFVSDYYTILLNDGTYAKNFGILMLSLLRGRMELARMHRYGDRKWSMFFPKEGTLTPLLTILNLTSTNCLTQRWKNQTVTDLNCMEPPTFSTNMLVELHEDDAFQHFIRIKYNGQYVALCEKADTKCEYRNFWGRLSGNYNTTEYNQTCYGK